MTRFNGHEPKFGNLIPEFERCVERARPRWFLMENVRDAPLPVVPGYVVRSSLVNNRWFVDGDRGAEEAKLKAVANGVPLPMGRAIARAVKRAMAA
jgi:site-specific DNA-cytosine methylase